MEGVIVTTSGRPSQRILERALAISKQLQVPFIQRKKRSVPTMKTIYHSNVLVVEEDRLTFHSRGEQKPFFFHPNAAMFRAKHWLKTREDPMVHACGLTKGDRIFDATLGLGSDAILASLAVGQSGRVIGAEKSKIISFIVGTGLKEYVSYVPKVDEALRRIEVLSVNHLDWLVNAPDHSVDVVYFDPMFEESVTGSDGFEPIRIHTAMETISEQAVLEAKRVARKRVVLKDHFRSTRFQTLGFHVDVRLSATFHYGTIELED
ncbi:class I SAM-dependent methyltransferase [Evansella tamaricis]|uniref:Class I SAM-dependent methyltransferase n=1 Tax=Evansella tamaricis TaxID=2069301 RepID=A0ABS6JLB3_9BACI|nr:class I SAM-dependent methyltransferase [Evansella tamaricis]MBU9714467.1 class I SAM-dependent methyltransferase [Evansella tamaricis]